MKIDPYKKYERLLSCIPDGMNNAISQRRIATLLHCEERDVRSHVQNARHDGIPICSIPGQKGYYMSDNPVEVFACYRAFKQRNKSNSDVLKGIREYLIELGFNPDTKEEGENYV